MAEIEIFEQALCNSDGNGNSIEVGKVAILRGGIGAMNPKAFMDKAVSEYVKYNTFNQFVEIHLDNPWVRVIVKGINEVKYEPFNGQHL